jgi:multidrug efflux pump
MTSIAFIMGVLPLVFSSGAGSEMRHAMGVAVFSGMLGVTFFGLFLTPVFYVILRTLGHKFDRKPHEEGEGVGAGHGPPGGGGHPAPPVAPHVPPQPLPPAAPHVSPGDEGGK